MIWPLQGTLRRDPRDQVYPSCLSDRCFPIPSLAYPLPERRLPVGCLISIIALSPSPLLSSQRSVPPSSSGSGSCMHYPDRPSCFCRLFAGFDSLSQEHVRQSLPGPPVIIFGQLALQLDHHHIFSGRSSAKEVTGWVSARVGPERVHPGDTSSLPEMLGCKPPSAGSARSGERR